MAYVISVTELLQNKMNQEFHIKIIILNILLQLQNI